MKNNRIYRTSANVTKVLPFQANFIYFKNCVQKKMQQHFPKILKIESEFSFGYKKKRITGLSLCSGMLTQPTSMEHIHL